MPDLGQYAAYILWAYAATLVPLGLIVATSLIRARRVKAELARVEQETGNA